MADAPRAIRWTFSYVGGQVTLQAATRLAMRALPSHDTFGYEQHAGFWIELRDSANRVVYRRVLHSPMRHDVEVYPEAADQQFSRSVVDEPRGSFDVVTPDLPTARAITLYASLPEPAPPNETETARQARIVSSRSTPARLIAQFTLPQEEGA